MANRRRRRASERNGHSQNDDDEVSDQDDDDRSAAPRRTRADTAFSTLVLPGTALQRVTATERLARSEGNLHRQNDDNHGQPIRARTPVTFTEARHTGENAFDSSSGYESPEAAVVDYRRFPSATSVEAARELARSIASMMPYEASDEDDEANADYHYFVEDTEMGAPDQNTLASAGYYGGDEGFSENDGASAARWGSSRSIATSRHSVNMPPHMPAMLAPEPAWAWVVLFASFVTLGITIGLYSLRSHTIGHLRIERASRREKVIIITTNSHNIIPAQVILIHMQA